MSYQPIVAGAGLVGWRFLQATYDNQFKAFTESASLQRDVDYFRENLAKIETAEQLVADRRLLTVALGAFGLQDDINNKYFIQKILEDGTSADDALANRLTDDRYKDLSEAFGFGPLQLQRTGLNYFAEEVIAKYEAQSFEIAVGNQDDAMRIALYGERTLQEMATEEKGETALWYNILGEPPLRELFETGLGLPSGIGSVDLDRQLTYFKEKALRMFGDDSVTQFADPEKREKLMTAYMARVQVEQYSAGFSSASAALQLLQASAR
ncbi:MAG: flagellar protein [Rhodobacteraceae bacterium]|nr:flagellar protein [Paracoccaceae bacterium]